MAVPVPQFSTVELQIMTSITSVSSSGSWATSGGVSGLDCLVINRTSADLYLVVGTSSVTALNQAGGASGTKETLIPSGAIMVIGKGATGYFAAINDTGLATGNLYLHSGRGA